MNLDRVVIVTGAGRGIGVAVAKRFVGEGARVAIVDLVEERASATAKDIGADPGRIIGIACDVRSSASVAAMYERVRESLGPASVLVNGAGSYFPYKLTHETTEEEWDSVVDSNLKGMFLCCRAVLPDMIENGGGRIINFASNAARSVATALGVEYTAAKTGVLGLTRHIAKEYAQHNILVNAIAPGPTDVERVRGVITAEFSEAMRKTIPLQRLGQADEIAAVVQFLASESASFMTGATVDVNGGIIMV